MRISLPLLVSMLCASVALAEPPAPPAGETEGPIVQLVNDQLLLPLKKAESKRARFSRAAPVPVQRRVRVLDTVALTDGHGRAFVRFAVDARRSWNDKGAWQRDSLVGCAYLDAREVFVRQGEAYVTARGALGREDKERADVCRPADGRVPRA